MAEEWYSFENRFNRNTLCGLVLCVIGLATCGVYYATEQPATTGGYAGWAEGAAPSTICDWGEYVSCTRMAQSAYGTGLGITTKPGARMLSYPNYRYYALFYAAVLALLLVVWWWSALAPCKALIVTSYLGLTASAWLVVCMALWVRVLDPLTALHALLALLLAARGRDLHYSLTAVHRAQYLHAD